MADQVQIMDFAADDEEIEFYVGPDRFVCVPDVPLGMMQKVTQLRNIRAVVEEQGGDLEPILQIFDELLTPESATLFRECITVKKTIGVRRLMKILPWIMEKYGLRPTQPSTPSLDGSVDGESGTSSTDGVSPEASTSDELAASTPLI